MVVVGGALRESTGVRFHWDQMGGHAPGVITSSAPMLMGAQSMGPEGGQFAGGVPEVESQLCPRTASPSAPCGLFIQTQPLPCSGLHILSLLNINVLY